MFENTFVHCTLENGVAVITINNPPMNPLSEGVIDGIRESFHRLSEDDSVRAVILTGAGEKAFVAGADIKEFPDWTPDIAEDRTNKGQRLFSKIENFKVPVIAAVNGYALGGGLELALSCDIRIASENARMGLPEVTLGIVPGYGGTQRLCRTINVGEAKKMIFTGEMIKADHALALGLVQEVLPLAELLPRAKAIAEKIAQNGPIAVRATKRAINCERNFSIQQGIDVELAAAREVFSSEDKNEGVGAFIEKRKAVFKNR
jgi:enoyl-CoA hydratase